MFPPAVRSINCSPRKQHDAPRKFLFDYSRFVGLIVLIALPGFSRVAQLFYCQLSRLCKTYRGSIAAVPKQLVNCLIFQPATFYNFSIQTIYTVLPPLSPWKPIQPAESRKEEEQPLLNRESPIREWKAELGTNSTAVPAPQLDPYQPELRGVHPHHHELPSDVQRVPPVQQHQPR